MHTFGHGAPVLGPDGDSLYFVFHHMRPSDGSSSPRRAFMAPLAFVDVGDGRGDVWVRPVLPSVDAAPP